VYFEPLKNNTKLEKIFSNHQIPNWLKNHVENNSADKSMVLDYLPFEP
jgi:esterase/lipase superfamily enzyme